MQPGGQLCESDDAIAEDKRKASVLGSLEGLCANESVQMACVDFDWMGMERNLLASTYAAEVRKIYAMPDAIASEPICDADIIDRFIGDIYEQFLPALEERVRDTREELSGFIKNELGGRCLLNVQESHSYDEINPPEIYTQKGKEALREDLVSVIPALEESQRTGITSATVDAVKFLKEKLKDAGVN